MKSTDIDVSVRRESRPGTNPIFPGRWSPRSMSGEGLAEEELMDLFEAARWAPSSYNNQPWRFLFARRGTPAWDEFLSLLVEANQGWAKSAAALVVVLSGRNFEHNGKPSATHSFDAGAAWMSLALQGTMKGLVVHAMQGFDHDRARESLGVPDDFAVEVMIAVGRPGEVEDLPEGMREREAPSGRKALDEIVFEGRFPVTG